ncbi:DUF3365 domain-containing protein [Vibrio profundum]|uniref:Tll0287-like domain-containing protein n=1 Tax=Vibrio profundum TaxID=2910247 RepID=UPI003D0D3853
MNKVQCLLLMLCTLIFSTGVSAMSKAEVAEQFSTLFLSFKISILTSQPLINDPNIGDKGLTGPVIIEKTKANYKSLTGKEFQLSQDPTLRKAQETLFFSIDKLMTKVQPIVNREGLGFKGLITAVMARRLAKLFTTEMGGKMSFKFTAPDDLLRSKANKADTWEEGVFEEQFRSGSWDKSSNYSQVVGEEFRWMQPVYHEAVCMNCHGDPKGERDVTGAVKEGAKVGDLAGAFSIKMVE